MSDCCDPVPYRRFFNRKEAGRRLRNYRRRGLDGMATRIVGYLNERGMAGQTFLEVGGGVGDLGVELLRAGASTGVNVELSAAYEEAAAELLASESFEGRVERVVGDFVAKQDTVDGADVVMLNRVICCYPFMDRMMDAVLPKTGSLLGIVVPRDRWASQAAVAIGNGINRLRGCGFRAFVHSVGDIEERARAGGMRRVYDDSRIAWQGMVFERS